MFCVSRAVGRLAGSNPRTARKVAFWVSSRSRQNGLPVAPDNMVRDKENSYNKDIHIRSSYRLGRSGVVHGRNIRQRLRPAQVRLGAWSYGRSDSSSAIPYPLSVPFRFRRRGCILGDSSGSRRYARPHRGHNLWTLDSSARSCRSVGTKGSCPDVMEDCQSYFSSGSDCARRSSCRAFYLERWSGKLISCSIPSFGVSPKVHSPQLGTVPKRFDAEGPEMSAFR